MSITDGDKAPTYVDGTWGDVGISLFDLIGDDEVPVFEAEIARLEPGSKTVVFKDGRSGEFDAIVLCTGFQSIFVHYQTFVDKAVMEKVFKEPKVWEEMDGLPGLWITLGGIASSRFGQQILADRVAASLQNRRLPSRVLTGPKAYWLGGVDPGMIWISTWTLVINVIAGLALLGWYFG